MPERRSDGPLRGGRIRVRARLILEHSCVPRQCLCENNCNRSGWTTPRPDHFGVFAGPAVVAGRSWRLLRRRSADGKSVWRPESGLSTNRQTSEVYPCSLRAFRRNRQSRLGRRRSSARRRPRSATCCLATDATRPATIAGRLSEASFVNTYLPRLGGNGFGMYDVELTSVWGVPLPTKEAPLVITPGFATHWLDGPSGLDIPSQLHEVYTEFRWLPKIGDSFRADVAVQPGYYSDWDGSTTRAVRILGHGAGIYDWTPTFQIVLGVAYLDRPDIELLPIAGIIWKPDPDAEYRLVFPEPKISWRLNKGVLAPGIARSLVC